MLFKTYDPLKGKTFQILDETGKVVNESYLPKIDKKELLKMYRVMSLGRIADIKSLQYQRQGRMLTFPPSRGQEAAQVGPMAASSDKDWLVTAFRELGAMLYKGVTIEQTYLYWYGNEMGSHFNEGVKVLPINVPIGSQIGHAAGLAYASKIKQKGEVSIAYIGDGGTSHGEFHEGLNFAAVYDVPMIIIIQNNQYAISTPRIKQTKSTTLAQKAISYGIPGIQVDGNDVLAMYVATSYALERARKGEGPTLIEAVTYRLGPHTTSDDPTIYRSDDEVKVWEKRDPLIRFKQYLLDYKFLTEKEDLKIQEEVEQEAVEAFKKVENSGLVSLEDIFKFTYEHMTPQLVEQYENYKKYLEEEGN